MGDGMHGLHCPAQMAKQPLTAFRCRGMLPNERKPYAAGLGLRPPVLGLAMTGGWGASLLASKKPCQSTGERLKLLLLQGVTLRPQIALRHVSPNRPAVSSMATPAPGA